MLKVQGGEMTRQPQIIAGACGYGVWPANSIEGACGCVAAPVDGIEIDVHLTAEESLCPERGSTT